MKKKQKKNYKDITLRSLKTKLRRLPEVEVPETLKARLFAAITTGKTPGEPLPRRPWHPGAWDFTATAAAIVLIGAIISMLNLGLSLPSTALLTDINDTSLVYPRWNHTTVICDQNAMLSGIPSFLISVTDGNSR